MFLIYAIAFITFLFIGSFFGVLIDRIYRGEQFIKGHSYCEHCQHQLHTLDLIPVFSYVFLNGKCRYCRKSIPMWLPIVEITTALTLTTVLLFITSLNFFFPYPIFAILVGLSLTTVFLLIFFTDAKYMVIPDIYLYLIAAIYPFYFFIFKSLPILSQNIFLIKDSLIAAAALGIFFAALHYGSRKKAMGDGDIYLSALIGLYLGTRLSIVMWFIAFLTGAIFGVILLISKKKKMKSAVPFGPFLILGMCVALIYGEQLLNWYLSI